jgi:hypothetical protein
MHLKGMPVFSCRIDYACRALCMHVSIAVLGKLRKKWQAMKGGAKISFRTKNNSSVLIEIVILVLKSSI